jgi:hypothetical protein
MSIELSSAPVNPKTVASAAGHASKGKVKSDASGGSTGSGFSAILTALEPQLSTSPSAELTTDDKLLAAMLPMPEPALPLPLNLPTELAMLLEQAGQVVGDKLSSVGDESTVIATPVLPMQM